MHSRGIYNSFNWFSAIYCCALLQLVSELFSIYSYSNTPEILIFVYLFITHTASPFISIIVRKEDDSLPAMFNPLYSSTNQHLFKRTSAIKVTTMKIMDDLCYELMEAIMCLSQNQHFSQWEKINGTQRRALVSLWRMHLIYRDMAKGTSWAEATLNSKKIKPIALVILELCWSEGISQAVSQSVENSITLNSIATIWKLGLT